MKANVVLDAFDAIRDSNANRTITRDGDNMISAVVIVDGDPSARESLERLVRTAGLEPKSFPSAEDFLAHPRSTLPCCLILDATLPGLSGLELQKQLEGRRDVQIVFTTSYTDVSMTVRAMKAGAVELLTKPVSDVELLPAIKTALERSRAALRHDSEMQTLGKCYSTLSRREREVMTFVVSGLLNKQVGSELGITETTVKAHRGQVMRKMEAESLPDLVIMATKLGLLIRPASRYMLARRLSSMATQDGPYPTCS
jgi:FixJ family two-component response regulator